MIAQLRCRHKGFTLIEALLVIIVIGIAFFGLSWLYGNVTQNALTSDLTILATKLAREKMDEISQTKADSGYAAIVAQAAAQATSGTWTFTRQVAVSYVNPADMSASGSDTGYKRVDVMVSWGTGVSNQVTLTTLFTNMVPSSVTWP